MTSAPTIQPALIPNSASSSTVDASNFSEPPNPQADSIITPNPPDSNCSQCDSQLDVLLPSALDNSQTDVPLPSVLDSVTPSSPPSIDHSLPISSSSLPILRKSTRPHHPPAYLSDYFCKAVSTKPASGL
nr:hypothetical protein CFP56_44041 [Quercus suber]